MVTQDQQLRRYEFKKALQELESLKGRGTELVTLYIPPDKQISDVVQYLREEFSTSSNIKSKSTRKNVLGAIESIMSRLKYYKAPPETGLVFFVGHVSTRGDQTEMYTKIVEPPEPIQTYMYKCDSVFHTEQLRIQLQEKEIYGLIVIDRKEATIGFLNGTSIQMVSNEQSLVPSKHHQGGQSSRRYERLIEIAAHEYFKKVGEIINNAFMPLIRDMRAVFVGGPGATKEFFAQKDYLRNEIKQKIEDLFDLGYTDESGLRELVDKASSTMKDMKISREKDLMNRFMMEIKKADGGLGVYGINVIMASLQNKSVDLLLVSEGLNKKHLVYSCPNCGNELDEYAASESDKICPRCSNHMELKSSEDLVETIYTLAEAGGATVEIIGEDSDEGKLLKSAFGGMAGILRYATGAAVTQ